MKIAPSTRPEPLNGGFQVDGASGSENTFIIDGQEVTHFRTGVLRANDNLPFSLVQEVQIKSSGFEAEFGGATGGVINVVTKGGGNEWHGEFGSRFRPGSWQGSPPSSCATSAPAARQLFRQLSLTFQNTFSPAKMAAWNISRPPTSADQSSRIACGSLQPSSADPKDQPELGLHLLGSDHSNDLRDCDVQIQARQHFSEIRLDGAPATNCV